MAGELRTLACRMVQTLDPEDRSFREMRRLAIAELVSLADSVSELRQAVFAEGDTWNDRQATDLLLEAANLRSESR